jgi:DNA-binding Xre family transcriptional regulator
MIHFNPKAVFAVRGIEKPYTFMVKAGIPPRTASKILNSQSKMISVDHLEKLCVALHCTPDDLFEWVPSKNVLVHEQHPLHSLKRENQPTTQLHGYIQTLPLKKLKEIEKLIQQNTEKNKEVNEA